MYDDKELENGRPAIYDFDDFDLSSGDFVFFDTEDDAGVSHEQDVGAHGCGSAGFNFPMGGVHSESIDQGPSGRNPTPDDPPKKAIPFPYTSFAEEKKVITALEDFGDEEEQWAAYAIYHAIQEAICLKKDAFRWIFSHDSRPITFEQCCHALYARPDVLRLRLLYELWRIGKSNEGALQVDTVSVPSYIQDWAFRAAEFKGIHALQTIWENPGIHAAALTKKGISKKITDALHAEYIISQTNGGHYYVTGINPIARQYESGHFIRSSNRSWSSYFPD